MTISDPGFVDEKAREARRASLIARLEALDEFETRQAEKSLRAFLKLTWQAIEPAQKFVDSWHIGFVSEHLQAVYDGQIKNLIINQPPATSKSIMASVAFPSWIWTKDPAYRFLCLSNVMRLSTRDSRRMRDLVMSEVYQNRWQIELRDDQNVKTLFHTTKSGWRMSVPLVGSFVGEHPHGKIIDDPHSTDKKVLTDNDIQAAIDAFDFALPGRGATLNAWTILMMQRLHERDLSGHWLSKGDPSVYHICLPMEYEPPKWIDLGAGKRELRTTMKPSPLGLVDPRTTEGELLCPKTWPREKVDSKVKFELGEWGRSGQFQQRPTPAGGLLFKSENFQYLEELVSDKDSPDYVVRWTRCWDVAATEGGSGPRTAGVRIGITRSKKFIIDDVKKDRLGPDGVDSLIWATANADGKSVWIFEEHEGGSAGKSVILARKKRLAGWIYSGISTNGESKPERAFPFAVQVSAKNVFLVVGKDPSPDSPQRTMMREFVEECTPFPRGAIKDQVDAGAMGINALTGANTGDFGLLFAEDAASVMPEVEDEIARLERELGITLVSTAG